MFQLKFLKRKRKKLPRHLADFRVVMKSDISFLHFSQSLVIGTCHILLTSCHEKTVLEISLLQFQTSIETVKYSRNKFNRLF